MVGSGDGQSEEANKILQSVSNIDYSHPPPWPPNMGPRRGLRGNFPIVNRGRGMPFFPGQRFPMHPMQPYCYNPMKQRPHWNRNRPPPPPPIYPHGNWNMNNQSGQSAPPHPPSEDDTTEEGGAKKKRRSSNGTSRPWDRAAAEKALALELECQKNAGSNAIVIRFPDPELSKDIVQAFHGSIENVHFQAPCAARYCFVTLKEDSDVEKVMKDINKIKFGAGFLQAERKVQKVEEAVGPENIDPFTLYVGNLPTNISTLEVKEKFPTANRIDVGYAQKMKYTRYAFIRYSTAEAAFEAYRSSVNTIIASRSIILRFRRHKAPVGPPGQKPSPSVIETKPGEKLTVGAKLKAKKEKLKAEKVAKDDELKKMHKAKKIKLEDSDSDEDVELEKDDDSDVDSDIDDDDDDDLDDDDLDDDDDDDDDDLDSMAMNDDDDMEDDIEVNIKQEDDHEYASYSYSVNLDQLTKKK